MTVGTIPHQLPVMRLPQLVDLPIDDSIVFRTAESVAEGCMHHLPPGQISRLDHCPAETALRGEAPGPHRAIVNIPFLPERLEGDDWKIFEFHSFVFVTALTSSYLPPSFYTPLYIDPTPSIGGWGYSKRGLGRERSKDDYNASMIIHRSPNNTSVNRQVEHLVVVLRLQDAAQRHDLILQRLERQ